MEDLGPLFVHPHEPYRFSMVVIAIGVAGLVIAVTGVLRGRLSAVTGVSGLILVPCFAYLLGNLTLIEKAKNVEFCGSCHETMGPIVSSLHYEDGSLASVHYTRGAVSYVVGCYSCHSGYGVWGGTQAKIAGMQHMWHTVTRHYDLPLRHHGTFDVSACLDCHAEAHPFRAVEAHREPTIQQALLGGDMTCTGMCHPKAHPASVLNGQNTP